MAKRAAAAKVEEIVSFEDMQIPEGASEITGDIVGYWDFEKSAIRAIPRGVKMFDGQLDSTKVSCLIIAELTQPCPTYVKDEEDDENYIYTVSPVGQMVGIWYKPGMRAIVNKAGVDVYIRQEGEKDTGKPNPMKKFKVFAGPGGTKIPIIEDTREDSEDVLTVFHDRSPGAQRAAKAVQRKALPDATMTEEEEEKLFE